MPPTKNSWLRSLAIGALVLGIAIAGVLAGRAVRRDDAPPSLAIAPPTHGLSLGDRFPSVALLDEGGLPLRTDDLWPERGAVVLLLDLECAPCGTMIGKWQDYAASDSLARLPVVGIAHATPSAIRAYRSANDVAFPVHADTAGAFLRDHSVMNYPLCAIVSRSGVLQSTTFDPQEPVHARELWAALGR